MLDGLRPRLPTRDWRGRQHPGAPLAVGVGTAAIHRFRHVRQRLRPPYFLADHEKLLCSPRARELRGHGRGEIVNLIEAAKLTNGVSYWSRPRSRCSPPRSTMATSSPDGVTRSSPAGTLEMEAKAGHCSVNGTPTRKPSTQTLPPEIERRDRERQCGSFRASRASRVAPDSGKAPETREKTCPRLLSVEVGRTAWRWGESGANRSRPLDAAIAPRRPPRELAGVRETGLDYVRVRGSSWELGALGEPSLDFAQRLRRRLPSGCSVYATVATHGQRLHLNRESTLWATGRLKPQHSPQIVSGGGAVARLV